MPSSPWSQMRSSGTPVFNWPWALLITVSGWLMEELFATPSQHAVTLLRHTPRQWASASSPALIPLLASQLTIMLGGWGKWQALRQTKDSIGLPADLPDEGRKGDDTLGTQFRSRCRLPSIFAEISAGFGAWSWQAQSRAAAWLAGQELRVVPLFPVLLLPEHEAPTRQQRLFRSRATAPHLSREASLFPLCFRRSLPRFLFSYWLSLSLVLTHSLPERKCFDPSYPAIAPRSSDLPPSFPNFHLVNSLRPTRHPSNLPSESLPEHSLYLPPTCRPRCKLSSLLWLESSAHNVLVTSTLSGLVPSWTSSSGTLEPRVSVSKLWPHCPRPFLHLLAGLFSSLCKLPP